MNQLARIVSVIGLFVTACGGGGGGGGTDGGSDAPPADASVDVPTAGIVRVSFRQAGAGVAGARVVFLDAAGTVVTSTTTDAQGQASTTMEPGGTVMLSPVTTSVQTKQVYVWLAVAPGDQLAIARPGSGVPRSIDMTLTVPVGPTGTGYTASSRCGGGYSETTAVPLMLDDNCTQADIYVEYMNSQSPYEFRGAVFAPDVTVADNGTANLSTATIYQRATMQLAVSGLPTATTSIFAGGHLQRGGDRLRPSFEATSTSVTQGAVTLPITALPAIPAVDLVALFQIRDANTGNAVQMLRRAPVATTSTVALAGHVLPFLDAPAFDHNTRALTWLETGGDRSADAVFAQFEIDDGSYGSEWFVIAPHGSSPTVTLPAFPPDLAALTLGPNDEVAVGVNTIGAPGGYAALRPHVFTISEEFDLATPAGIVSTSYAYHDED